MKRSKKATPAPRWPKGHPAAGQFADKTLLAEYLENVKQLERETRKREAKDRKNAAAREARKALRDAREAAMAKPDAVSPLSDVQALYDGWGSASTSRMRENTSYAWHGAFRVRASGADIGRILSALGSESRKPTATGDGNYEVLVTPHYGFYTPKAAFAELAPGVTVLQDHANDWTKKIDALGGQATYLGAFYNRERIE